MSLLKNNKNKQHNNNNKNNNNINNKIRLKSTRKGLGRSLGRGFFERETLCAKFVKNYIVISNPCEKRLKAIPNPFEISYDVSLF